MIAAPVRNRRRARCPAPGTSVASAVVSSAGPRVENRRTSVRPAASSRSSSGWARGSGPVAAAPVAAASPRDRGRARRRRPASCAGRRRAGRSGRVRWAGRRAPGGCVAAASEQAGGRRDRAGRGAAGAGRRRGPAGAEPPAGLGGLPPAPEELPGRGSVDAGAGHLGRPGATRSTATHGRRGTARTRGRHRRRGTPAALGSPRRRKEERVHLPGGASAAAGAADGEDAGPALPSGPVLVHAGHPLVLLETIPTDATAHSARGPAGTLRRSGCRGRAAAALHDEAGSSVLRCDRRARWLPPGRAHPMSRPPPPGACRPGARAQLPSVSGAIRRATAVAVRSDPVPVGWNGNGSVRPCRSRPARRGRPAHARSARVRSTPVPCTAAPGAGGPRRSRTSRRPRRGSR